jgi:hypothetical protein
MIGLNAQGEAKGAMDEVRQGINQGTKPYYDALPGQIMPESAYAVLSKDPAYVRALSSLRADPVLNGPIKALPDQSLAVVNEVQKRLHDLRGQASMAGENQLASLYAQPGTTADALARALSANKFGNEYALAHDTQAAQRGAQLAPLEQGPLGQVAGTDQVGSQTRALFPTQPLEGGANETAAAIRRLTGQGGPLVRQHLANTFNEASSKLVGGDNAYGGAKWAATVAGNPEQERALLAGVGALPNGGALTPQLESVLKVFRATGRREAAGSQTAFNTEELKNLGEGPSMINAARSISQFPDVFKGIGEALAKRQISVNTQRLSKALTANPDQAEAIMKLARAHAGTGTIRRAVNAVIATDAASRGGTK